MFAIMSALLGFPLSWLRPKHQLALEVLALRHQITVLKRQTRKPKFHLGDRFVWVLLKRYWPDWKTALMIFQPETVIGWQRVGFRIFWRWKSRHRIGRPGKDRELIELIQRMWSVNPTWGSPRIRDELAKLGLQASAATIRKYRPWSRHLPSQGWRTFLQNHAGGIAAMDFFVVPTVTCRCSTSWSWSHTSGVKSFISTSPERRQQSGPPNRSSMPSRTTQRPSTCCGTAIRSTDQSSCSGLRAWASSRS